MRVHRMTDARHLIHHRCLLAQRVEVGGFRRALAHQTGKRRIECGQRRAFDLQIGNVALQRSKPRFLTRNRQLGLLALRCRTQDRFTASQRCLVRGHRPTQRGDALLAANR
ncbi:hypothetical protein AWB81_08622 [Caballeronia arationis]|nr:hypothetical protein AWB81_08622 [Caballeronia arationis]